MSIILYVLGGLCYVFAAVDLISNNFFQVDLTGVFWSPIAAGAVGALFFWLARKQSPKGKANTNPYPNSSNQTDSSTFVPPGESTSTNSSIVDNSDR